MNPKYLPKLKTQLELFSSEGTGTKSKEAIQEEEVISRSKVELNELVYEYYMSLFLNFTLLS